MASSGVIDKGEEMMAAIFIHLCRYIKNVEFVRKMFREEIPNIFEI